MKIKSIITDHIEVFKNLDETFEKKISKSASKIMDSFNNGGILYLFGNGGSASDSQHIAAEFSGRFVKERIGLPAISLNTDTSALTAIGNDYGYENVFSRQVEALVKRNDVVIGISTSGNSPNIINGINKANDIGAYTITLTGKDGGKLKRISSLNINIDSNTTARIQEAHIFAGHLICTIIDEFY